jgi:hypothetical protein
MYHRYGVNLQIYELEPLEKATPEAQKMRRIAQLQPISE